MKFVVTETGKPDYFEDRVAVGDRVLYNVDFTPWLEGKGNITSTTWLVQNGSAGIVNTTAQSALISFSNEGKSLISCLIQTSTGEAKKVWLIVRSLDRKGFDDYGFTD